jgi:RNA polymerase sigma-70 factor (ECF subfamily)
VKRAALSERKVNGKNDQDLSVPADDVLMKKLANGSKAGKERSEDAKAAFRILFERHGGLILGYCSRILGDRSLAEDVSQDVWMKVIQNAQKYEARNQLRSWLLTLSRNTCLNVLRSRKSFVQIDGENESEIESEARKISNLAADEGTAIQLLIEKDGSKNFKTHLDSLPAAQRTALSLLLIEELSYEEIARAMELSLPAVKTHIHRGRKNLEGLLQPRGDA